MQIASVNLEELAVLSRINAVAILAKLGEISPRRLVTVNLKSPNCQRKLHFARAVIEDVPAFNREWNKNYLLLQNLEELSLPFDIVWNFKTKLPELQSLYCKAFGEHIQLSTLFPKLQSLNIDNTNLLPYDLPLKRFCVSGIG